MIHEPGPRPRPRLTGGMPVSGWFPVDSVVRLLLGMGVVAILAGIFWYFAGLILYLVLGVLVAYILRPVVDHIQRVVLGRIPAILVAFVLFFGGTSILMTLLFPLATRHLALLSEQVARLTSLRVEEVTTGRANILGALLPGEVIQTVNNYDVHTVEQLEAELEGVSPGGIVTLGVRGIDGKQRGVVSIVRELADTQSVTPRGEEAKGVDIPALGLRVRRVMFVDAITEVETKLAKIFPVREGFFADAIVRVLDTIFLPDRLTGIMGLVVGFFTEVFYMIIVVPFVAFFLLKDGAQIRRSLYRAVPNRYFEMMLAMNKKIEANLGRYFRGLFVQSFAVATMATGLLMIAGLDFAFAVGIFTGIANTIPYFGPLMGFVAAVLLGVAQTGDFSLLAPVLIAMGMTQVTDNLVFQPLIFARAARVHPLVILFAVLIGAQVGGILGMLVAIPVTTVVLVALQQVFWSIRNYRIIHIAR